MLTATRLSNGSDHLVEVLPQLMTSFFVSHDPHRCLTIGKGEVQEVVVPLR